MRKRRAKKKFIYNIMVFAVLLLLVFATGGLMARYIASRGGQAEMISSEFHFSGEYLEETASSYEMTTWGEEGIVIPLYNYEKDNTALVSDVDITYQVTVTNGTCDKVLNGNTIVVGTANGEYTMAKSSGGEKVVHMLYIKPDNNTGSVNVMVKAIKPYAKTLSVNIELDRKAAPEWSITENTNYIELVIESNDWSGQMTVKWDGKSFSPDNQNTQVSAVSSWVNAASGESNGSFLADAHSAYTLIFFKNINQAYTGHENGTGTIINIGGDQ